MVLPPVEKAMSTKQDVHSSVSQFLRLFRCKPSEQGSNRRKLEDSTYGSFVAYVREVFGKEKSATFFFTKNTTFCYMAF